MPLFAEDVSEYVMHRPSEAARLVVEIEPPDLMQSRQVRAHVDDDLIMTGQFIIQPEWTHTPDPSKQLSSSDASNSPNSQIGAELFTALFSGSLSRCWARAVEHAKDRGALHVIIRSSDLVVHGLPWELLFDRAGGPSAVALTDGWSVIRQCPREPADELPAATAVATQDLRVLVLTALAGDVPQDRDPQIIESAFGNAEVATFANVQSGEVVERLGSMDAHIVHLLGTGARVQQGHQHLLVGRPEEAEAVTGRDLVDPLTKASHMPRLVVLAARNSDLLAAEVAPCLPNIIGIRGRISQAGRLAFLRGLYQALASGSTIDQAVASGRAQQIGFSQSLGNEWASPVLFLSDPTPLVLPVQAPSPYLGLQPHRGQAKRRSDELILGMKRSNLDALREQWGPVAGQAMPKFVQDEIDALTGEVQRLTNMIERGPG